MEGVGGGEKVDVQATTGRTLNERHVSGTTKCGEQEQAQEQEQG